ncbi:hypothetical protein BC834DRAFT_581649 [Gloeopeniophorella convolvens]|nr:hypothetical protein BC834DRAFT_581649 [Gloeopeniophorella convolvens]
MASSNSSNTNIRTSKTEQTTAPAAEAQRVASPSDMANPTRVDTAPQQATEPGSGTTVPADSNAQLVSPTADPTSASGQVPWKEQVIAYAKKTRGSVLRKVRGGAPFLHTGAHNPFSHRSRSTAIRFFQERQMPGSLHARTELYHVPVHRHWARESFSICYRKILIRGNALCVPLSGRSSLP